VIGTSVFGQDTLETKAPVQATSLQEKDPLKAAWLSTLAPGAGQIYNGKYWKLPLLYGGAGACAYFIRLNHREYALYRNILRQRRADATSVDAFTGIYDDNQVRALRDFHLRNRDFTVILASLLYVLNIVDAHVDAHLMQFDVSDNIALQAAPVWSPANQRSPEYSGVSLTLHFK
jgi:hypothetical protein